ncbi:hypothetical protein GWK47_046180 [Chionoecetes opilio]|uniref:Uncharacterized protein n=1 Tax=Chionoecetes opilio TaxID=41210 RepID=A0A8J5CTS5_CHIOP|nr:hypothetical protein GWK47_046180 [Chionoecetes opilio]
MDKYVKRSDSDRSRSVSGDSSCSSVSYRTSTPAPSASRTHTPQGTSDISLSDVELDSSQLFTQDIEESGTEQEDQRKRQEGTRQLKAMLWHLEKHFFSLLAPEFSAPSRRTLGREIDQVSATPSRTSSVCCYDTSYVATTADSWTVHNRAFIGMTCHWIGQDLRRQHGTLACKEIKEKQTNVVLAQAIFDVHHEFGLGNKVVATTTDNGANYVAAFKYFCNARYSEEIGWEFLSYNSRVMPVSNSIFSFLV